MPELTRDALFDELQNGRLSPVDAEVMASKLGLEPLNSMPDLTEWDPMEANNWSLTMTVAWICWRTPEKVRSWWREYRLECWDWRGLLDTDGNVTGWELEQRSAGSLGLLSEVFNSCLAAKVPEPVCCSPKSATNQIWDMMGADQLSATGMTQEGPKDIPRSDWAHLKITEVGVNHEPHLRDNMGTKHYWDIKIRSADVVKIWHAMEDTPSLVAGKPSVIKGRKDGYAWELFEREALRILEDVGGIDPAADPLFNQAALERRLAQWFQDRYETAPVESTIRARLVPIIQKFDEGRKGR